MLHAIAQFGAFRRDTVGSIAPRVRIPHARLVAEEVSVSDAEIVMRGSKAALESFFVTGQQPREGAVPSFDRECDLMAQKNRLSENGR